MIDLGVMDDFTDNKKTAILKNLSRRICEIDRALDAIAKTKLFRQAYRGGTHCNGAPGPAHFFDNIAPIVRLDLLLDGSHHVGRAQVHFLAGRCAAGNQVRTHGFGQRNSKRPFSNGWTEAEIGLSTDDHWSTSSGPGGSLN